MNQILMIDNNKNKKGKKVSGGPIEISSIARFFAIAILLFGLVLSGSGAYAMISESQNSANSVIPEVLMQRSGNTVNVNITNIKYILRCRMHFDTNSRFGSRKSVR